MTWKVCRVGNHLPWIKFHGRDAIEDPKARIHQLTRAQRWTWLETLWHLANCRHPETGERGHGYDSNGEVISDAKWREIVSVSDSVWIRFVFDSVDKLRLFGRHSDGALYLTNPHKVVPAKDNTAAERMRRHRRYAVTPVTVTPEEPEPEPEPEPEGGGAAASGLVAETCRKAGWLAMPAAVHAWCQSYPEAWVCDAIRRSAEAGKLRVPYIAARLQGYQQDGGPPKATPKAGPVTDPRAPLKYRSPADAS